MSEKPLNSEDEIEIPVNISDSVVQMLNPDTEGKENQATVKKECVVDQENQWIEKLALLDSEHSKMNDLDADKIETMLRNIAKYVKPHPKKYCAADNVKLTDCLKNNKGNTLACQSIVEGFEECLNKFLFDAVREGTDDLRKKQKVTYAQRLEEEY